MMNLVSLTLVLTSLVTGAVWSPPPPPRHTQDLPNPDHRDVIVKEGHRVVVVEFENEGDDGNTKVLISPHDPSGVVAGDASAGKAVDAKENSKVSGPGELLCDAFGKCKQKIATVLGTSKNRVSEEAHQVSEKAHQVSEKAHQVSEKPKEAVGEAIGKVSEKAHQVSEKSKEAVGEAIGKAKEAAEDLGGGKVSETAKMVGEKAKGAGIGEMFTKAKELIKDTALKTSQFDVMETPKRIGEDVERNVTGKVEEVKEQAKETEAGAKNLGEILAKFREVIHEIAAYVYLKVPEKVEPVMGLIHMLGFSTAYGMCVWVTFVSSYILGRALPRQQFAVIQSKIYPVYFRAMAHCVGAALTGYSVCQRKKLFSDKMVMFQGFNLASALVMILANLVCLEPRATKMMFERMKIEKEEGRGIGGGGGGAGAGAGALPDCYRNVGDIGIVEREPEPERRDIGRLNEKLKKVNTYSSALNVSTLVVLTWHVAYMGQWLQATL